MDNQDELVKVMRYNSVNHLVLNLYRDGYSVAVKLNEFPVFTSETILETARISYEEDGLLDYIENGELPPLLVEMIDSSSKLSQYKIWHDGCLILEVRDKIGFTSDDNARIRRSHNHDTKNSDLSDCVNSFFTLLKPTNLSILYDVLNLTDSNCWSAKDRLQLESQIVLHNSPSLCLEPDFSITKFSKRKKKLPHKKLNHLLRRNVSTKEISNITSMQQSKINYTRLDKSVNSASIGCPGDNGPFEDEPSNGLPPQLALQQFIAAKKSKRKENPTGIKPRFFRFKDSSRSAT